MSACGTVEEAGGFVRVFWCKQGNAHRALDDAIETKQIFEKLLALMDERERWWSQSHLYTRQKTDTCHGTSGQTAKGADG